MPNRVTTDSSTFSPTAKPAGAVPSRFNFPELARVWNGWPALTNGAKGTGVKAVQVALSELGFNAGIADGVMGPTTAGALKGFQKSKGLAQSGKIDRDTLAALHNALRGNAVEGTGKTDAPKADKKLDNDRFKANPQLGRVLKGEVTLGNGSKGDGVKAVQQALSDMGFSLYGGADGGFGAQSEKAVKNFQLHAARKYPEVKPTGVVDQATLRALDALAPKKGQKGQSHNLPSPRFQGKLVRVIVVKEEHRTYLFDKQGKLTDIVGNATGAVATTTDTGLKKVTTKLDQKASDAAGQQLWGGKVFGARILDLSWADGTRSGEELHGTNVPNQLGGNVSHGCVRHANEDIVKIYNALSVGELVAIVDRIDDPRLGKPS